MSVSGKYRTIDADPQVERIAEAIAAVFHHAPADQCRRAALVVMDEMRGTKDPYGVCGCGTPMDEHGCPHGH